MHLILSLPLFIGVETRGWLYDDISSDPIHTTLDGKYEYRLDLINMYQKNSREQLMVRDVITGAERFIPVELNTNDLDGIRGGGRDWSWAVMSPTEVLDQYLLTTTETLSMPQKRFIVDIRAGTSQRIE